MKPPPDETTDAGLPDAQSQKLESLGLLAGGIAHDVNNILSVIEGYAQIALRQPGAEGARAELQKILQATQRGAGLTRQLLAFAQQRVDPPESLDLAEAVRAQEVLLNPLLGPDTQLVLSTGAEPLWVMAAGDFITQILINLTVNARDAMPSGGAVQIACRAVGPEALLSVQDTGCGIPPAVLPHIFDPFFTTKPRGRGTGLGLAVVHGIVRQLGGRLETDTAPGGGSCFKIFLPRIAAPAAIAVEAAPATEFSLKGRTVLIAEDEPELRDVLGILFAGMEMKVLSASNGNDALALQRGYAGKIDFLLTDIVMPGMDGLQLGALFEAARPDSNVIYMSGYPLTGARGEGRLPPDAEVMTKPLRESKIRDILRRALERRDERLGREKTERPAPEGPPAEKD